MTRRLVAAIVLASVALVVVLLAIFSGPPEVPEPERESLKRRLDRLRSVPYTSVTEHEADSTRSGVQIYRRDRTWDGYNLYCPRTSAEVILMDMTGEIVHRWNFSRLGPFGSIHAVMLPDGDVIVLARTARTISVIKMTWDSRISWRINVPAHHEIAPLPDGTFYMYVQDLVNHRGIDVDFSAIVRYSPEGKELERWSLHEHMGDLERGLDRSSFLDTVLDSIRAAGDSVQDVKAAPDNLEHFRKRWRAPVYDYFHPNAITILPDTPLGREDDRFREGNLMVCFRNVNQVAILDRATGGVVWAWGEGELEWPHHPTMTPAGNILIFDNGVEREASRVIELNPVTLKIVWEYGSGPGEHFYSYSKGSAQRLPNGNTLICDSDNGRAFEVTADKQMVWEWFNPAMEDKRRVQVYRMERLSPDEVGPLLATSP
jgi:hypothetical protein